MDKLVRFLEIMSHMRLEYGPHEVMHSHYKFSTQVGCVLNSQKHLGVKVLPS